MPTYLSIKGADKDMALELSVYNANRVPGKTSEEKRKGRTKGKHKGESLEGLICGSMDMILPFQLWRCNGLTIICPQQGAQDNAHIPSRSTDRSNNKGQQGGAVDTALTL